MSEKDLSQVSDATSANTQAAVDLGDESGTILTVFLF